MAKFRFTKRGAPASLLALILIVAAAAPADGGAPRGIPIGAGDQARSAIRPSGDKDVYVLDAYAGSLLTATVGADRKSGLLPTLEVLDPAGAPLDTSGYTKTKAGKVTLARLPLPRTGRYALVVGGASGSEGEYRLKTKTSVKKKTKTAGAHLPAGGTLDIGLPGRSDVVVNVAIKDVGGAGFEVLGVVDPDGRDIPGGREAFTFRNGKATGTLVLSGPLGEFALRLGGGTEATTVDVVTKIGYPKARKRKHEISPLEPVIVELDPALGRSGGSVDIGGLNFVDGDLEVWFGDLPAKSVAWKSDALIRAVAPDGEGEVTVTVQNPDGQAGSSPVPFGYIPSPPEIVSVNPAHGPDTGGTAVDVFGEGLGHVVEVILGGVNLVPESVEEGRIRLTTPPQEPGARTLVLVDAWGQNPSLHGAFTYYGPASVSDVQPAVGSVEGGTSVVLVGANLNAEDRVFFGSGEATVVACPDSTRLTVATPAHAAGAVAIRIEDPWGRSTTLGNAYEFIPASVTPAGGEGMPQNGSSLIYAGRAVAMGDLNGDDDMDIVIGRLAGDAGPKLITLVNDGAGTFTDGRGIPEPPSGIGELWDTDDLALGDIDGDGDLDLVVTCGKRFESVLSVSYIASWSGIPVVAYRRPACSTRVLLNDGSGTLTHSPGAFPSPTVAGTDLLQGDSIALGDVDGDDDLDIVLTSRKSVGESSYTIKPTYVEVRYFKTVYPHDRPATRVLLNDGKGTFTNASGKVLPRVGDGDMLAGDCVLLGDIDGDGALDVVLTGDGDGLRDDRAPEFVSGSKTRILLGDGRGSFRNSTGDLMPEAREDDDWGGVATALADLDGDDDLDLVLTTDRPLVTGSGEAAARLSATRVLLQGARGFEDATSTWMPAVREDGLGDLWTGCDVLLADFDGDGRPDLFLVDTAEIHSPLPGDGGEKIPLSSLRWLWNAGRATFVDLTEKSLPDPVVGEDTLRGHAIAVGDVDGDDDLDLVLTTELEEYLQRDKRPTRLLLQE